MNRISSTFLAAAFLLTVFAFRPVFAAGFSPDQLYTASVPVASQDNADVQKALQQALAKVMVRLTGQKKVAARSAADQILKQASDYASRYGFQTSERGMELQATFDSHALDRALLKHGFPLWGHERPETLVWLVVYSGRQRQLIRYGQADEAVPGLLAGSRARGLPLLFPASGQGSTLEASDITGGFQHRIAQASQGYSTQYVLFGQIQPAGSNWRGSASLMVSGRVQKQWNVSGASRDDVLHQLADHLADYYASRYAIASSGEETTVTTVAVQHLKTLDAYAQVSKYLGNLTGVSHVGIKQLRGDTGYFQITSDRNASALSRLINLSPKLEQADEKHAGHRAPAAGNVLEYRYHP